MFNPDLAMIDLVCGDAVNHSEVVKFFDGGDVCGVYEEFHGFRSC
jgi:hypothetical protein